MISTARTHTAPPDVRGARILVLDDVPAAARLVAALLEAAGYTAVVCENDAHAALERHGHQPFDLILVDLLMPGMDGLAFLERLRGVAPFSPVAAIVMTSAHDQVVRALESGARDFIAKPVSAVELVPRVRNALQLEFLLRGTRSALADAEHRYRVLVEQSIAGIYIIEADRWTYANPRMCELLGYSAAELNGMPTLDLVVEEDRPRVLANRVRREFDRSATVATYRMRRKDGAVVVLNFDARVIDVSGRHVVFGVALDITERERSRELLRQADSHYRALVEQSIAGIYLLDNGRFSYANPRMCEMLDYSMEELGRLTLMDLVLPEDAATIVGARQRRAAGERGAISFECALRRKDGAAVHVGIETKIIEVAGADATLGVAQDITASRRAQEALRAANRRLRSLSERVLSVQEEERRRISRELHDDIGQSLVALGIGLHRASAHLQGGGRALLDECIEVAAGIREKVREISLELHPPHLDQLGLQDALRWLVDRQAEITGVAIECRFGDSEKLDLAPAVEAACYRICQEALSNSTRHASAHAVTLELVQNAGEVVLSVRDDGVGFDQASQRESLIRSGHMGLISMEERARLAGGRLEVRSAPDAGTIVSAVFPSSGRDESTRAAEPV